MPRLSRRREESYKVAVLYAVNNFGSTAGKNKFKMIR